MSIKHLQLTGHNAFQSFRGTIWHSTRRFDPPGRQLSANTLYGGIR